MVRSLRSLAPSAALAAAVVISGCLGDIGSSDPAGNIDGPGVNGKSDPNAANLPMAIGPSPLRRLTRYEYDRTVHDLLGDTTGTAMSDFPDDVQSGLFDNTAHTQTVSIQHADQYFKASEKIAMTAVNQDLDGLVQCDTSSKGDAECGQEFVYRFGRKAFRRPLTTEEANRYIQVFENTRGEADFKTGVRAVVTAFLVSPYFLFRPEFGDGPGTMPGSLKVTPYEMASRLSYGLWSSMPDDELLDEAEAGRLSTPEQIRAQAVRMLEDPKARPAIARFYRLWLNLNALVGSSKDSELYPEYNEQLEAAMIAETEHFIEELLWEGDGRVESLFSSRASFVNGPLAKVYGIEGVSGDGFVSVEHDAKSRAGILTHASVMTLNAKHNESAPVKRGAYVRERFMCTKLSPPPGNVPPLPPVQEGLSTRERLEQHVANPKCAACHNLIDGVGFGLEEYDGIGRIRSEDQGVPVDSSGEVIGTVDMDGPYVGGVELATKLAQSEQVRDCLALQWFRYMNGREEELDDARALATLKSAFAQADGRLPELMILLTQIDTFLNYRRPE